MVTTGFILNGSMSFTIPTGCSMILHTVSTISSPTIHVHMQTQSLSKPLLLASLPASDSTVCVNVPINSIDCPVVLSATTLSECHFIISHTDGFLFDSLITKQIDKEIKQIALIETGEDIKNDKKRSRKAEKVLSSTIIDNTVQVVTKQKKKIKIAEPVTVVTSNVPIVVAQPPTDLLKRSPWKVDRSRDHSSGVLVPGPKQITKGTGVLITDYIVGKGGIAKIGSKIQILYEALFADGSVLDKHMDHKAPFVFRLGTNQVVRGLDLGIEGMRIGGAREIVIPPELGYGKEGSGAIPANQVLIFRVYLLAPPSV